MARRPLAISFLTPSRVSCSLETCQQFDVAWRIVGIGLRGASCPVRLGKLRPSRLKLLTRLLLVTYTFLQGLNFSEAR